MRLGEGRGAVNRIAHALRGLRACHPVLIHPAAIQASWRTPRRAEPANTEAVNAEVIISEAPKIACAGAPDLRDLRCLTPKGGAILS
jgi:hypothetical protein